MVVDIVSHLHLRPVPECPVPETERLRGNVVTCTVVVHDVFTDDERSELHGKIKETQRQIRHGTVFKDDWSVDEPLEEKYEVLSRVLSGKILWCTYLVDDVDEG